MSKIEKLSDSEKETMVIIWNLYRKVTSSEIMKIFNEKKGKKWSPQTISTFLSRIVDKGILKAEREGRTNYYYAVIDKEDYERDQAENIINNLYKGSLKNFLSALYYNKDMSEKEYEEINEWFSKK